MMDHVLCHNGYTQSRHEIFKSVDAVFSGLEPWMDKGLSDIAGTITMVDLNGEVFHMLHKTEYVYRPHLVENEHEEHADDVPATQPHQEQDDDDDDDASDDDDNNKDSSDEDDNDEDDDEASQDEGDDGAAAAIGKLSMRA
ncbi:hypothetical protein F4782DRAFT_535982 [Xylaria castorea]|nr:hypothetical protein F4782DRAFT_535982 [Xylaria castorea]